jgi:hypothetical protein
MAQPRSSPACWQKQPRKARAGGAGGGLACRTPRDFLTRLHNPQACRVPGFRCQSKLIVKGKPGPGKAKHKRNGSSILRRSVIARGTKTSYSNVAFIDHSPPIIEEGNRINDASIKEHIDSRILVCRWIYRARVAFLLSPPCKIALEAYGSRQSSCILASRGLGFGHRLSPQ